MTVRNSQFVPSECRGRHWDHCRYHVARAIKHKNMHALTVVGGDGSTWDGAHFQVWYLQDNFEMHVLNFDKSPIAHIWKPTAVPTAPSQHVKYEKNLAQGQPVDCVLVLDNSGSMHDDEIKKQNHFGKALTNNLLADVAEGEYDPTKDSRVSIVQFASAENTKLCQELSSETIDIHKTLRQDRIYGSTATDVGVKKATDHLLSSGRPSAQKVIVLVTDGMPNDQKKALLAADEAKRQNILFFCVSVGVEERHELDLQSLASEPVSAHYIKAESFDALPPVMEQLLGRLSGLYSIDIHEFDQGTLQHGCRNIPVLISNETYIDHIGNVVLECDGGDLFKVHVVRLHNGLPKGQKTIVHIDIVPQSGVTMDQITKHGARFKFNLRINSKIVYSCFYNFSFALFNGGLKNIAPNKKSILDDDGDVFEMEVPHYNVYFIGTAGTGKSSYITSAATAVSPFSDILKDLTTVGNGNSHCTESLNLHENVAGLGKFRFYDTKGLEKDVTSSKPTVEKLLKGHFPAGWNFIKQRWDKLSEEEQAGLIASAPMREADAVVFCITAEAVENDEDGYFNAIKEQISAISHLNHNVIVLVTKMDEIFEGLKENPCDLTLKSIAGDLTVESFLLKAKGMCGLNRVMYVVNYTDETERSFEMDSLAMKTMVEIKNCCASRRNLTSMKSKQPLAAIAKNESDQLAALKAAAKQKKAAQEAAKNAKLAAAKQKKAAEETAKRAKLAEEAEKAKQKERVRVQAEEKAKKVRLVKIRQAEIVRTQAEQARAAIALARLEAKEAEGARLAEEIERARLKELAKVEIARAQELLALEEAGLKELARIKHKNAICFVLKGLVILVAIWASQTSMGAFLGAVFDPSEEVNSLVPVSTASAGVGYGVGTEYNAHEEDIYAEMENDTLVTDIIGLNSTGDNATSTAHHSVFSIASMFINAFLAMAAACLAFFFSKNKETSLKPICSSFCELKESAVRFRDFVQGVWAPKEPANEEPTQDGGVQQREDVSSTIPAGEAETTVIPTAAKIEEEPRNVPATTDDVEWVDVQEEACSVSCKDV